MTIHPHLHIFDDRDPGACLASIVSCLATRHVGDHQRNQRRVRFLPKQNRGGGNSCELCKFQRKKLGLGQWLNCYIFNIFRITYLVWKITASWFQSFFIFTRNPGEMIQFDEHIFQLGWFNHKLGRENKVQSCISGSIG